MTLLKTVWLFVFSAMVLITVSCLQYGELSTRFDSRAVVEVRTKTVTGRLGEKVTLVEASINGSEPGWFMLVSGSSFCILDARYVTRVNKLTKSSQLEISYPCKLPVDVYRAKTFTVGALTIKNLDIASFDLSAVASDYDVEIIGMVGFPVFQHAVVKIEYGRDGSEDRVSLYDPDKFEMDDIEWQSLGIYGLQSVMRGRVNRAHNAPFVIDTGYHGPVGFYSAFVANHNVLEGRKTTESESHTVCGSATVLESTVRVFEIGGQSYDEIEVEISTPGSITDVGGGRMGGSIGREFLENFDVVFDCSRQRIALLEK